MKTKTPSAMTTTTNKTAVLIVAFATAATITMGVMSTACGYRGAPAQTTSYTVQANKETTVTVHPPPPNAASTATTEGAESRSSTTTTTSAALSVDDDRNSGGGAERHPLLTEEPQGAKTPGHPNSRLAEVVRQTLRTDEKLIGVPVDRIRVVTIDGYVTLMGAVPTLADKVEIEQRVREIKGVDRVDNQIDVVP